MFWAGAAFVAIALTLTVSISYFYLQYARSPEKEWRDRVITLVSRAKLRLRMEKQDLSRLRREWEKQDHELRERALAAHLAAIPVQALDEYPGIGPATVAKLSDAGYSNLARLRNASIRLPGLGAKRLADIRSAVQQLVKQSLTQFEAGAYAGAQELARQRAGLQSKYEGAIARAQARSEAAEAVLAELADAAALVRKVTFLRYFWAASGQHVPRGVQEATLPDLDRALEEAKPALDGRVAEKTPSSLRQEPAHARRFQPVNGSPAEPASDKVLTSDAPSARAILEIEVTAPLSPDLIRRQFNVLSERYAADRFASMGQEFIEMAKIRREAIHAAAIELLQPFGATLEAPTQETAAQALRHNPDLDAVFGV
jgi:hypothetical protein